jgi:hypothetical protein
MPAFLFRLALLLFLLTGCRTASPAPQPPGPEIDELLQLLRADPDDSLATYGLAARYAVLGEKDPALRWMKRLEELRWSFGLEDLHFGAIAQTPEYRAIAARLAAFQPQVARSRPAFTLAERALTPEGITYDPATNPARTCSTTSR